MLHLFILGRNLAGLGKVFIYIAHAGPVDGKTYLIAVDTYSKWIEVEVVKSKDATYSAKVLRKWFAMNGLSHIIVSDNGPSFASSEFGEFLKSNGVRHMFTAPYHPSSNGQAEANGTYSYGYLEGFEAGC